MSKLKPLYVFGDTHLGVERGGTTPATKEALKENLLARYSGLLDIAKGSLLLNGDGFDTDKIALKDLFECYRLTSNWLSQNERLYLSEGNHCAAGNADKTSSFDLLCKLLQEVHGEKVVPIYGAQALPEHDAYVISSLRNQDLFDAALAAVPPCTTLYLHCNYDNFHAVASQHSLNLTKEQALALPVKRIVMSHEHGHRKMLGGKVHLIGAPFCSSVSDCLASSEKFMVKVTGDQIEYIQTWQAEGSYCEMDWRSLADNGCDFVRVTGTATAAESSEVISAVSRFRSRSKALVITTAVKVEGQQDTEEMQLNADQIAAFDVRSALMEILSAEERAVIAKLESENV